MATGADPITILTGSGVIGQGLDWFKAFSDFFTTVRGQDVTAATNRYAVDAQTAAQRYQAFLNYQANMAQIRAQYDIDLKNYGLNVANHNFQQRVAAAQLDLAQKAFGLDIAKAQLGVDQFNFAQRAGVADRKLAIIDMLARRSGPSDWVAYNSILNQLDPPSPDRSTTIDPFKILDGLYQPATLQLPDWAQGPPIDPMWLYQPYQAQPGIDAGAIDAQVHAMIQAGMNSGPAGPAAVWTGPMPMPDPFAGGGSIFTPQPQPDPQPSPFTPDPTKDFYGHATYDDAVAAGHYSGVPYSQVAHLKPGEWALVTTGPMGPSKASDYQGFAVWGADRTGQITGEIPAGTAIWLQKLFGGGVTSFPHLLVGDKPTGRTGYEEIVINLNPEPDDALLVLDRHQTKKLLDAGGDKMLTKANQGGLATNNAFQNVQSLLQQALGGQQKRGNSGSAGWSQVSPGFYAPVNPDGTAAARLPDIYQQPASPLPAPVPSGAAAKYGGSLTPSGSRTSDLRFAANAPVDPNAAAGSFAAMTPAQRNAAVAGLLQRHGVQLPATRGMPVATLSPATGLPGMTSWLDMLHGTVTPIGRGSAPGGSSTQNPFPVGHPAYQYVNDYLDRYGVLPPQQIINAWSRGLDIGAAPPGGWGKTPPGAGQPLVTEDPAARGTTGGDNRGVYTGAPGYAGIQALLPSPVQLPAFQNILRALAASRAASRHNRRRLRPPVAANIRPLVAANTGGIFTANTDPYIQVNQYSPDVLGSQPFIQKVRGQMPATPFAGFGGVLSNPDIGVEDMPSMVNLQVWRNLTPSEKDALEELYNRGLGVDMRDIMERSRRAAPIGASFGPTRYGR